MLILMSFFGQSLHVIGCVLGHMATGEVVMMLPPMKVVTMFLPMRVAL